jgi:hypothetical protein
LGVRHQIGVGRIDAVDVRIDLAHIRVQGSGQCHCRGIRTTTAERGHVLPLIDALKASHHSDFSLIHGLKNTLAVDLADAGFGVYAVR